METQTNTLTERLVRMGLTAAAEAVEKKRVLFAKLDIAYAEYRFVEPEKIEKFNATLYGKTFNKTGGTFGSGSYQILTFTPLAVYPAVPPAEVLEALEGAIQHGCFDRFEVAQITEHSVPKPDPLLFGIVDGCPDRFFIAQWDDDVKIEDLLQGDEGYVKGV